MISRRLSPFIAWALLGALPCVACEPSPESEEPAAAAADEPSPAARAEATKIFETRCVPCHGAQGAGDGPTSKSLTPPPRNLREAAFQTKVDDPYIERVIQYGGAAVGKSPAMPPNPDLAGKPEVLKALRAHVRSLRAN